ncbi:hypothetical protein [Halobiforma nitratireducens]|uniref:Uncharacterized protein n=1 Tax=Halobiforma nitratireducens JCM 10879 TaxID=1227454 RepID=M0LYN5_9EURY|nr:hypothetical protein [Halobiforma nitratireducens]EMA38531.1 hypothetical protein C446_09960 [Halobiforma nitratireducens JCM 10879]
MGSTDPPPESSKEIDEVYHDRNLLAIAFARAIRITWGSNTAGWYWHDGWPVVWVDTPAGQKSWHVTPDLEDIFDRSSLSPPEPWIGQPAPGGLEGRASLREARRRKHRSASEERSEARD